MLKNRTTYLLFWSWSSPWYWLFAERLTLPRMWLALPAISSTESNLYGPEPTSLSLASSLSAGKTWWSTIEPAAEASFAGSTASGVLRWKTTSVSLLASTDLMVDSSAAGPLGSLIFCIRWIEKTTSAAVSGCPLENFSPLCSVQSYVVVSLPVKLQDCAASGCGTVAPEGNFSSDWNVLLRTSQEPASYAPAGSSTLVTLTVPMVIALLEPPPVTALVAEAQPAAEVATIAAHPRTASLLAEVIRITFLLHAGRRWCRWLPRHRRGMAGVCGVRTTAPPVRRRGVHPSESRGGARGRGSRGGTDRM